MRRVIFFEGKEPENRKENEVYIHVDNFWNLLCDAELLKCAARMDPDEIVIRINRKER